MKAGSASLEEERADVICGNDGSDDAVGHEKPECYAPGERGQRLPQQPAGTRAAYCHTSTEIRFSCMFLCGGSALFGFCCDSVSY